jgi:hypothetical protein
MKIKVAIMGLVIVAFAVSGTSSFAQAKKPNIVFIMGDVTSPATTHYAKLHAMLTDHSPLHVSLFTERAAAAKWLGVPVEALTV